MKAKSWTWIRTHPHLSEKLDPDPHESDADPQPRQLTTN
jgi:hypothetical protein